MIALFEKLDFYTNPTFWVGVAFAGFVALLLWRKVPHMIAQQLDERAKKIRFELDEAQQLRSEAEVVLKEYKKQHAEASAQADAIQRQACEDAQRMSDEATKRLAVALERLARTNQEKLSQLEAAATKEIKTVIIESSIEAVEAALRERLDAGANAGVLNWAIKDLTRRLN